VDKEEGDKGEDIMSSDAEQIRVRLLKRIKEEVKNIKPRPLYRSRDMIWFLTPSELISYIFRSKVSWFVHPVYRYVVKEKYGNYYYYEIKVKRSVDKNEISLIAEGATDFSGRGSYEKMLIETFIRDVLRIPIEDLSPTILIGKLRRRLERKRK